MNIAEVANLLKEGAFARLYSINPDDQPQGEKVFYTCLALILNLLEYSVQWIINSIYHTELGSGLVAMRNIMWQKVIIYSHNLPVKVQGGLHVSLK